QRRLEDRVPVRSAHDHPARIPLLDELTNPGQCPIRALPVDVQGLVDGVLVDRRHVYLQRTQRSERPRATGPRSSRARGRVTVKTGPPPAGQSGTRSPPWSRTMPRLMYRPSPEPRVVPEVESLANFWNRRSRSPGGTPGPWSRTTTIAVARSAPSPTVISTGA